MSCLIGSFLLNLVLGLQFWMIVGLEVLDYIIYRQGKKIGRRLGLLHSERLSLQATKYTCGSGR